jgi:hypothetical protein
MEMVVVSCAIDEKGEWPEFEKKCFECGLTQPNYAKGIVLDKTYSLCPSDESLRALADHIGIDLEKAYLNTSFRSMGLNEKRSLEIEAMNFQIRLFDAEKNTGLKSDLVRKLDVFWRVMAYEIALLWMYERPGQSFSVPDMMGTKLAEKVRKMPKTAFRRVHQCKRVDFMGMIPIDPRVSKVNKELKATTVETLLVTCSSTESGFHID